MIKAARRFLSAAGIAAALASSMTSCQCPGLLNRNCSLRVDVGVAEDDSKSRDVVIVVAPSGARADEAAELTSRKWFEERKSIQDQRSISLLIRDGRVAVQRAPKGQAQGQLEPSMSYRVVDDGKRVELRFRDLQNPDQGGYSELLVFSTFEADAKPLRYGRDELVGKGWRVDFAVSKSGVSLVN
ncbi:MAG: hypothetical protein AAFU73_00685 [Planctomycetota bacterium]